VLTLYGSIVTVIEHQIQDQIQLLTVSPLVFARPTLAKTIYEHLNGRVCSADRNEKVVRIHTASVNRNLLGLLDYQNN